MRILFKDNWVELPLDYAAGTGEHHVTVQTMLNIAAVDNAYFRRARDWRMVVNYIREIGLVHTLTKVLSRRAETLRNEKYLSVGYGYVLENGCRRPVYFVAPFHPSCADMLALSAQLLCFTDEVLPTTEDAVQHAGIQKSFQPLAAQLEPLVGWSAFSGAACPPIDWTGIKALLRNMPGAALRRWPAPARTVCSTVTGAGASDSARVNATLFGFGNYAKTAILPSLPKTLQITRIHEVDPLQITPKAYRSYTCSSAPDLGPDDTNSVFFIAGYHHTHAGIAVAALAKGAQVVVEKPLVTTRLQLQELQAALRGSTGQYFACFHKRYQRFNAFVREDMQIDASVPINYHAIVYEVPLPQRHWYLWPNSRSRIVSNGCHWLDHFLFLNGYNAVTRYDAFIGADSTVNISVALDNDALFSMVLTDSGSERLGVQDHIELRQGSTTIKMVNGGFYRAENRHRIVRTLRCNRMESYQRMYRSIGAAIVDGKPGDSLESIVGSSSLTLSIEELMQQKTKG